MKKKNAKGKGEAGGKQKLGMWIIGIEILKCDVMWCVV